MRIDIAAQTDIGKRKRNNEDFYGVFREDTPGLQLFRDGALLCVADGLGGHEGGEIASKLAVSVIKDILKEVPPAPAADAEEDQGLLPVIREGIRRANETIFRTNQDLITSGRPMGTTLIAAVVTPRKVYIGTVGDSRCYHLRDGEIIAKTEDHSWVDEQVKQGLMTKAEAESDMRRHVVTRSIGTHPAVDIDTYIWHVVPGDTLLVCTDGLINMAKDSEILNVFANGSAPADIAHRLIDLANDNGGRDNITVIVADISPSLLTVIRRRLLAFSKKRGANLFWFFLVLLYGVLCFTGGAWWAKGTFPFFK
ncbi:MAG: protein phosphatase 2C domain-containing protein [Candidatus Hydrogenedentes bacterium]|nr:protein phosphatase 2C domain-containing protein [Candidatus Hydrogenedentota bacterium]